MMPPHALLNMQELAAELRVSRDHLLAMKHAGFPMPGGRATIQEVLDWRKLNPGFQVTPNRWKKKDKTVGSL